VKSKAFARRVIWFSSGETPAEPAAHATQRARDLLELRVEVEVIPP
jgi:hypothetical protein